MKKKRDIARFAHDTRYELKRIGLGKIKNFETIQERDILLLSKLPPWLLIPIPDFKMQFFSAYWIREGERAAM